MSGAKPGIWRRWSMKGCGRRLDRASPARVYTRNLPPLAQETPMQTIEIKNFSVIKHCKIEIKRFTVLIGPQASGKSVIAKLVYFFNDMFDTKFLVGITKELTINEIKKQIQNSFREMFPVYTWKDQPFSIFFQNDELFIQIEYSKKKSDKLIFSIIFSKSITKTVVKIRKTYISLAAKERNDRKLRLQMHPQYNIYTKAIDSTLQTNPAAKFFKNQSLFIPASRSFFSILQNNIFTLIFNDIHLDFFLTHFGEILEFYRKEYNLLSTLDAKSEIFTTSSRIMNKIISGDYIHKNNIDWISCKQGMINLENASSGQQEALPMLITLCMIASNQTYSKSPMVFIEEPEAHLFPTAQKSIIDLFSLIYHHTQSEIFLTTHSPYILSALNNLVTAAEADNEQNHEKVLEILGDACPVNYEDVAAYNVENGTATSIRNDEDKLIGTNIIDEVSDVVAEQFDKLLDLLYPK
jgi:AAA15 family ATPase/GTPase